VEVGAALEEGPTRWSAMEGGLATEQGEVTLQVSQTDDGRYSFQLISETLYPVELSKRLAGDPVKVVGALAAELREMAARRAPMNDKLVRRRLQNHGARLWADAVPEAIRRQFWEQADRITSFTIVTENDIIPWELLYPVDGNNNNGFLVEQFPVVRRVFGQGRARRLPLASAAYVVPPGSPADAGAEVEAVRAQLGGGIDDWGVLEQLEDLLELLDSAPPSVLHFACHNKFTSEAGSVITMADGPLTPTDLAVAVQKRALSARNEHPLIFLNACRTAGEIEGLTNTIGWAKEFMKAGAGAFLGSLWAVRSSAARAFAEAFYRAFADEGLSLGVASLKARQAIASDGGDPTWLAYSVYGNPSAITARSGDR
jgi:CHAT domain